MRRFLELFLVLAAVFPSAAVAQISPSKVITVRTSCSGSCPQDGLFCLDKDDSKLYRCTGGSWSFLADLSASGDMQKSTYDTDSDSTVDAAEGLASISAWSVRYEDRDTDGDGTADMRVVGDYDGDGTLEWIDDVVQAFVDWCAPTHGPVQCDVSHPSECTARESEAPQRKIPVDINGDGTANDPWCGTFVILPGIYHTAPDRRFFQTNYTGYVIRAYGVVVDESDIPCTELMGDSTASELSPWAVWIKKTDNMYGHTSPITFEGLTIQGYGARHDLDPTCDLGISTESCSGGDWCPFGWMNGLWTEGADDVTIRDYHAEDIDRIGLDIESGDNVFIENAVVHGSGEHCMAIARNQYCTAQHLELWNCGGINNGERGDAFVWIADDSSYRHRDEYGAWVRDVEIRDSNMGMITENLNEDIGAELVYENVTCQNVDEKCINVYGNADANAYYKHVVIRNVYTTGGHSNGVWVYPPAADYTRMENVTIENVFIDNAFDGTLNRAGDNKYAIVGGGNKVTIKNCTVVDSAGYVEKGIRLYLARDAKVTNNRLYLAKDGAIDLETYHPVGGITVNDNFFTALGSNQEGVHVGWDSTHPVDYLHVRGNVFREDGGTFQYGIRTDNITHAVIADNDISCDSTAAEVYGVYNWGDSDLFELSGNLIHADNGGTNRGANLRNVDTVLITGNWFDVDGNWLRFGEATSGVVQGNIGTSLGTATQYYNVPAGVIILDRGKNNTNSWEARSGITYRPGSAPGTCDASYEGTIYYDSSLNELCICTDASGSYSWQQVDGGGGC